MLLPILLKPYKMQMMHLKNPYSQNHAGLSDTPIESARDETRAENHRTKSKTSQTYFGSKTSRTYYFFALNSTSYGSPVTMWWHISARSVRN